MFTVLLLEVVTCMLGSVQYFVQICKCSDLAFGGFYPRITIILSITHIILCYHNFGIRGMLSGNLNICMRNIRHSLINNPVTQDRAYRESCCYLHLLFIYWGLWSSRMINVSIYTKNQLCAFLYHFETFMSLFYSFLLAEGFLFPKIIKRWLF